MSDQGREDDGSPPLVPPGGTFEGQVAVEGETLIEGVVRGTLRGPGRLELASSSRVEGVIDVGSVECRGHVVGPLTARKRAYLAPGAHFEGDLEAAAVEVDDEAHWIGVARVGPGLRGSPEAAD